MIIERIPNFLLSPNELSDYFAFDKNGRFIFCRSKIEETKKYNFIIYDILFNTFVELTPNPSILNIPTQYRYDCIWQRIEYYLPISVEQGLFTVQAGETTALLLLVHFNLDKKIYEILDNVEILKCQHPEFVRDGDIFGLFYLSSKDGRNVVISERDNAFLMLKNFTIHQNRIIFGEEKVFKFDPLHSYDEPYDPYLRNNKLWYIRPKPHEIRPAQHPPQPRSTPPDPTENNLQISYFDLNENVPSETFVFEIQIEKSDTIPTILQWVQDSLLFLQFGTKFNVFNLLNFEWTSNALDAGMDFTNVDANGKWEANRTWIEYHCSKNPSAEWAYFSAVHIDDEYVIIAVNRNSGTLHRIPLKQPLKLSMLAWVCALNAGLIHGNTSLPPKLPYSLIDKKLGGTEYDANYIALNKQLDLIEWKAAEEAVYNYVKKGENRHGKINFAFEYDDSDDIDYITRPVTIYYYMVLYHDNKVHGDAMEGRIENLDPNKEIQK